MDSVVTEDRSQADDRFDTARITAAVDALAEKHAGREDVFRQALAQLLKAEMIAARATAQIKKRESELVDEFKKKGLGVHQINRQSFVDAVLKNKPVESLGYDKKDYDRIVSIK
mgnify:CR=1 FL=1